MKVILCGYNWIGCKALSLLLEKGHEVFVYTHENPPHVNSLLELCKKYNVKFSTKKIKFENLPFTPDIICSIYYRYIISEEVIDAAKGKIFNLHPSLLPDYKGCSSLTWALINGEKSVGFTYHYINKGIDTGNIILQKKLKIEDWDRQADLYQRAMFEAAKYFEEVFEKVVNNFSGEKQLAEGRYYKRGCPFNGEIDENWETEKIERFIRAMNYPPLPYATLKGREIKTMAEYLDLKNNPF